MKCFYHSADLDGHCSGAIVKLAMPGISLYGINYGDPFPWDQVEPGEKVVMVDFAIQPWADMQRLARMTDLVWVDHHKSAIADFGTHGFFPGETFVMLSESQAACELAWDNFFEIEGMRRFHRPRAVHLLGRYDVWDHADPGVLPFQMGMRARSTDPAGPGNLALWRELLLRDSPGQIHEIIQEGNLILQYQAQVDADAAGELGHTVVLDGLRCRAFNRRRANSEAFRRAAAGHDAVAAYWWGGKAGCWTVSLYAANPGVDVSAVAKARGGGGHKGAAGFQCPALPWAEA